MPVSCRSLTLVVTIVQFVYLIFIECRHFGRLFYDLFYFHLDTCLALAAVPTGESKKRWNCKGNHWRSVCFAAKMIASRATASTFPSCFRVCHLITRRTEIIPFNWIWNVMLLVVRILLAPEAVTVRFVMCLSLFGRELILWTDVFP